MIIHSWSHSEGVLRKLLITFDKLGLALYHMYSLLHWVAMHFPDWELLSWISFDHDNKIWTAVNVTYFLTFEGTGFQRSVCLGHGHQAGEPGLGHGEATVKSIFDSWFTDVFPVLLCSYFSPSVVVKTMLRIIVWNAKIPPMFCSVLRFDLLNNSKNTCDSICDT